MATSVVSNFTLQANENQIIDSELMFTIQPAICVLTRKKNYCQQRILVEFEQIPTNSFCIYIVSKPNSKQCYQINGRLIFNYNIKTNESVYLKIEDDISKRILGHAEFKITKYQPLKKRRRFSWGLL